jgi:serine/threonine protein kinase
MKGSFKEIKDISKDAMHLVHGLLEVDLTKRLNCEKILCHPWLINVDVENCVWKNNLFTNAERVLLSKSNVDYRDISNRMDMIEGFTMKNLDTRDEKQNKNNQTKSVILAPFNSSNENESFVFNEEEEQPLIENNVIRFGNGVKEINRNYELNNNGEMDNGILIDPKYDTETQTLTTDSVYLYEEHKVKPNLKLLNEKKRREYLFKKMEKLGYNESYIRESLEKNKLNHATAVYYLMENYEHIE